MTTIDKTGASEAEFRARVAAFDAAPTPPEVVVETVARALWEADGYHVRDWRRPDIPSNRFDRHRRLAAAAIAARPPSPAEEAVKRVEDAIDEIADAVYDPGGSGEGVIRYQIVQRLRAALASPAPAPQRPEPVCFCGRLGHRLGGPILHKRTEECPPVTAPQDDETMDEDAAIRYGAAYVESLEPLR